jgi:hypothetical protein
MPKVCFASEMQEVRIKLGSSTHRTRHGFGFASALVVTRPNETPWLEHSMRRKGESRRASRGDDVKE